MGLKNLKDVNYKQFFFDHGERIGLAAAGVVALLLVLPLFWPGSGFLAPSAGANAAVLDKMSETTENGLRNNKPATDDLPGDTKGKLVAFNFDVISDQQAKEYQVAGLFRGSSGGSGGREMPDPKSPKESDVALVRFQLPALVYSKDLEWIETLKGAATAGPGNGPGPGSSSAPKTGAADVPGMPNSPSMPGFNTGALNNGYAQKQIHKRGLIRDRLNNDLDKSERDFDVEWVQLKKIKDLNGLKLAQQPYPMRAAEIVASFPYLDEIQEFRDKLGLPNDQAVLDELSLQTDDKGQPLHAFRFLGVNVERRQVDADGKPVGDNGGWAAVDLEGPYKPLIVLSGGVQALQPEDDKLRPVAFPGLVMHKLPTFGAMRTPPVDEYPKVEDNLPALKETVDALSKSPDAQVSKPSFTEVPGSIFDLDPGAGRQAGPGGSMPPGMSLPPAGSSPPPPAGSARPPRFPMSSDVNTAGAQQYTIPKVCLVRAFDFTVEPGHTYEYRLRVRMANPNFGRKDAASQGYASDSELPQKDWYVLPKKLSVPDDLHFYAVDQSKLDGPRDPKDKEPRLPTPTLREGQTTLQIQKWIDYIHMKNRTDLAVGDWVIAERVVATKGEPVGRQRVEVPYWRTTQDRFTMATDLPPPKTDASKKQLASVDVAFSPEGEEPVLVDFAGGDVVYIRKRPKTDAAAPPDAQPPITDKAPGEALLLTYDGKLLAHDAALDATDPDRVKRVDDERKWIKDVKEMKGGKEEKLFP